MTSAVVLVLLGKLSVTVMRHVVGVAGRAVAGARAVVDVLMGELDLARGSGPYVAGVVHCAGTIAGAQAGDVGRAGVVLPIDVDRECVIDAWVVDLGSDRSEAILVDRRANNVDQLRRYVVDRDLKDSRLAHAVVVVGDQHGDGVGAIVSIRVGAEHDSRAGARRFGDCGRLNAAAIAPVDRGRVRVELAVVDEQSQDRIEVAREVERLSLVDRMVRDRQHRRLVVDVNDGCVIGKLAVLVEDASLDGVVAGAVDENGARHCLGGAVPEPA